MGTRFFLVLLFLLLGCGSGHAAGQCAQAQTALKIFAQVEKIEYHYDYSVKRLHEFIGEEMTPDHMVGGFMKADHRFERQYSLKPWYDARTQRFCFYFKTLELTWKIRPQVYIAADFAPGSCMYNVVRAHEMTHYAIDIKLLEDYMPRLEAEIKFHIDQVRNAGPFAFQQREEAVERIFAWTEDALKKALDRIETEREKRQAVIDTPESYARGQRACSGDNRGNSGFNNTALDNLI